MHPRSTTVVGYGLSSTSDWDWTENRKGNLGPLFVVRVVEVVTEKSCHHLKDLFFYLGLFVHSEDFWD